VLDSGPSHAPHDGLELAERLRADGERIPILLITVRPRQQLSFVPLRLESAHLRSLQAKQTRLIS
jgi:CheY-like chemotaxis protein